MKEKIIIGILVLLGLLSLVYATVIITLTYPSTNQVFNYLNNPFRVTVNNTNASQTFTNVTFHYWDSTLQNIFTSSSLISLWKLDGNANDSSPTALYNGTLINTSTVPGINGGAYIFNSATGPTLINFSDADNFTPTYTNNLTVCIKANNTNQPITQNGQMIAKDKTGTAEWALLALTNSSKVQVLIMNATRTTIMSLTSVSPLNNFSWNTACLTYKFNDTVGLYLNGNYQTSTTKSINDVPTNTNIPVTIGTRDDGTNRYNGSTDIAFIYSGILTTAQMDAFANETLPDNFTNIAYDSNNQSISWKQATGSFTDQTYYSQVFTFANDSIGSTLVNGSAIQSFIIDTTNPSVTSMNPYNNQEFGFTDASGSVIIGFNYNIADTNFNQANYTVQYANGTVLTQNLTAYSSAVFVLTLRNYDTYKFVVYANDSAGNMIAQTNTFTVTPVTGNQPASSGVNSPGHISPLLTADLITNQSNQTNSTSAPIGADVSQFLKDNAVVVFVVILFVLLIATSSRKK